MIQTVILIHGGSFLPIRDADALGVTLGNTTADMTHRKAGVLALTQRFCDIGTLSRLKETEAELT